MDLENIGVWIFPSPACKPHSVHAGFPAPITIFLGRELPRASCSLTEAADFAIQVTSSHLPRNCLCLILLLVGVTWPQTLMPTSVVSYTTFSPLQPPGLHWSCPKKVDTFNVLKIVQTPLD